MTRDEAVKLWRDTLHPANGPRWNPDQWAERAIDCYVALGMLAVDKPKAGAVDRCLDVLRNGEWQSPRELETLLANNGLMLIECFNVEAAKTDA